MTTPAPPPPEALPTPVEAAAPVGAAVVVTTAVVEPRDTVEVATDAAEPVPTAGARVGAGVDTTFPDVPEAPLPVPVPVPLPVVADGGLAVKMAGPLTSPIPAVELLPTPPVPLAVVGAAVPPMTVVVTTTGAITGGGGGATT